MARRKRTYSPSVVLTVAALSVVACGGVSTNPPEPEGTGGSTTEPEATGGTSVNPPQPVGTGGELTGPCEQISCNPPEPLGGFGGIGGSID
jgi:hypothetical protein